MRTKLLLLSCCTLLASMLSCSKDEDKSLYILKTIDLVTNKPIGNVKIGLGIEVGCSKTLDHKEAYTSADGIAKISLSANQDTIDAFYKLNPSLAGYLNNSIIVDKEGYKGAQFFQDTGIFFFHRPIFAENKVISTYMYEPVTFTVDFINSKSNYSGKFIKILMTCYPKHPLLDPKVPQERGVCLKDIDSKNFLFTDNLAAISYDVEVIITEFIEDSDDPEVFRQTYPITIDPNNVSNNKLVVNY